MPSKNIPSEIGAVENHRGREKGALVYPVYSRRSGGLSVGINLFPEKKVCSFDCPYCEVFPFPPGAAFLADEMEEDLRAAITAAGTRGIPVRDICFSGNGEPAASPDFPDALDRAARVRSALAPASALVLITNGAGLLDGAIFSLLRAAARSSPGLDIWLKLDAGTPEWYAKMNRAAIPFETLTARIKEFAAGAPVTIQTMMCAVDGKGPPREEAAAWELLVTELARIAAKGAARGEGGSLRKVQVYGKARPAPLDPKTAPLPKDFLEARAMSLRAALAAAFSGTQAGRDSVSPEQTARFVPRVEVYL